MRIHNSFLIPLFFTKRDWKTNKQTNPASVTYTGRGEEVRCGSWWAGGVGVGWGGAGLPDLTIMRK